MNPPTVRPVQRPAPAGQLGPGGLDAARAEWGFFFADEVPALQAWVFGPGQAARITQPALVVLGADSARLTPLTAETVQRLAAMLPPTSAPRPCPAAAT